MEQWNGGRAPIEISLDESVIERVLEVMPGGAENVQDVHPLTPLQEGLLFHHLLNQQSDTYILSILFDLESKDDGDHLARALQKVIDRHDALRVAVLWEGLARPVQVVHRHIALPVKALVFEKEGELLQQLMDWVRSKPFKMELPKAPLIRLTVAGQLTGRHYALLQVHHLICDYQSLRIIVAETIAHMEGREKRLAEPAPFREAVMQTLVSAQSVAAEAFFLSKLADFEEPSAPFGSSNTQVDGRRVHESRLELTPSLSMNVRTAARRFGISPARFFHAVWGLVVARTSGRSDVVFGTVLSSQRPRDARVYSRVGLAVNTLPLRLRLQSVTAKELLDQTHRELTELLTYRQAPLTLAQQCSGIKGQTPLFSSLLTYRHSEREDEWATGARVRVLEMGEARTNYSIAVLVDDLGDGFRVNVQTDPSIDSQRLVDYLQTATMSLVQALEENSHTPAITLPILPEAERRRILHEWTNTQYRRVPDKLIHQLVGEQAQQIPDRVAASHENQHLTYAELDSRANRLGHYLRKRGIGPDMLVGVCIDRGCDMLVGVLGILKAGGAYLPLDPGYPAERLLYMVDDASPRVLLLQQSLFDRVPGTQAELIAMDRDWNDIEQQPTVDLDSSSTGLRSHHLAYVIYTSGSTGRPKGVMIEHRQVMNLAIGIESVYQSHACQKVALNASLNFDASVQQLLQLGYGRTLVVVPQESRRDVGRMLRLIEESQIEGIDCTPSQLRAWVTSGLLERSGHRLRLALVGGEAIDAELWRRLASDTRTEFYNVYGPTECTVDTTMAHLNRDLSAPHIGRPMLNRSLYILDMVGDLAPVGVEGEIHVGGIGVGRGYLNRTELTMERFLIDPFNDDPDARMYRTGDVGRWRPDGTIEYLRRNDNQVKIRGFRIELGEIETQLMRQKEVKDAVVIAREDVVGEKRLVAYVVLQSPDGHAADVDALRNALKRTFPDHMVPSAFVMLERLPTSPSGKLDRRALPAPDRGAYESRKYEAPLGAVEGILAGIWQELLRVEQVGRHNNFFELGGHSLLVMQMLERLRQVGLSTEVRRVFDNPTLSDLAKEVTMEATDNLGEVPPNVIPFQCKVITPKMLPLVELQEEHIEQIVRFVPGGASNIQDIYPLAPLQEGLLFHHLLDQQHGDTYVMPLLLTLSSQERGEALIAALQAVIDRHDTLRTAIFWEQLPRPVQVVYRRVSLPVREVTFSQDCDAIEHLKEQMRPERQSLSLRQAPLMRLQIASNPRNGQRYALLQLHHLICDNQSLGLLLSEVTAYLRGKADELPEPMPYRDHVAQALTLARADDSEAFFRRKLGGITEPTAPFGLFNVHGSGSEIRKAALALEPTLVQEARTQARRLGVSTATLFHVAWGLVIASATGCDDVVFGTVLLGRLQGSAGAKRILGMFINTLPLRLRLQSVTARVLVEQAQRELVELFEHEQAPLAMAQRCSGIASEAPLFNSLLNYRHGAKEATHNLGDDTGVTVLAMESWTNYPILLSVDETEEGFTLAADTEQSISPQRILGYLQTALRSLVSALEQAPQTPALRLETLPQSERYEVLEGFNATKVIYPQEKLIHQLFEEQVRSMPQVMALRYGEQSLTYAQLNGRANQLATYLRAQGVGADQPVGIYVERGLDLVVGVLGILKAGGAYVPLDPNYPAERLQYMLKDSAPTVVLTQERLRAQLPTTSAEVVVLDGEDGGFSGEDCCSLETCPGLCSISRVYVIYTSGSTGQPKGTGMSHRSMVNLIEWHRKSFGGLVGRSVLQFAALSFDVAFQEIFSTLCTGGTLELLDEYIRRDARLLTEFLNKHRVVRLFVPPLMLQNLAEYSKSSGVRPESLRDVITAGEQLHVTPEVVDFFQHLNGCSLHNHYGPTETHVVTTLSLAQRADLWPALPSIGRPISNTQIYILDRRQQPVPIDVVGEIYIGGSGVADGYLNRAELTAQRFLANPFTPDSHLRLYKTGDLGRWREDGAIEYFGRNDDQVKIRGFRIELGEIESQLSRHEGVREIAVVVREDAPGEKRLVAYVVPRESATEAVTAELLREHLKELVPEHMIPSAFVMLEHLPLTPSGKLDRRSLPTPDLGTYANREYEAPQGQVEEILAVIWQELLRLERVGRHDNFFELGGHSLNVMKLMVQIVERLGVQITVGTLFRSSSLAQLASTIATSTPNKGSPC